jgi:hypothetical protein
MDEQQRKQISLKECEELCDLLLNNIGAVTDRSFLWKELWLRLGHKLGHQDLMLPPAVLNAPDTPEQKIAAIRGEIYKLVESHSPDPRACMKIFDRIATAEGKTR